MLLLDWTILAFLAITIVCCWKLNNRISELKQSRKELQDIISNFDISIEKAENSIKELKELGSKTSYLIQDKLEKAKFLVDDLSFMTDRATNLADKLERLISSSRKIDTTEQKKPIAESSLEKQYSTKKNDSHELKKSTIESLLARIATVKGNSKKNNEDISFESQVS